MSLKKRLSSLDNIFINDAVGANGLRYIVYRLKKDNPDLTNEEIGSNAMNIIYNNDLKNRYKLIDYYYELLTDLSDEEFIEFKEYLQNMAKNQINQN